MNANGAPAAVGHFTRRTWRNVALCRYFGGLGGRWAGRQCVHEHGPRRMSLLVLLLLLMLVMSNKREGLALL